MSKRIAFRNARLIDPANKLDVKGQLIVENGRIADVGANLGLGTGDPEVIDCKGLVLAPGLIDMRVFTGEPGTEYRETLESARTMSHSRLRPMTAPPGAMTRRLPSATRTARPRRCTSLSGSCTRPAVE